MTGPRILLTNDDGIDAPGLDVLRRVARSISDDVWVVAPSGNQSGAGHRFTFGRELSLTPHGEREFSVDGSPADCVVAGITHVLRDKKPELVLSGINNGQNLGDIVHCSGTVAGAREGALHGAIGIAMSQGVDYEAEAPVDWACAETHAASVILGLFAEAGPNEAYFNVNFPHCPPDQVSGIEVVPHQRFSTSPFGYYRSRNEGRFFVSIPDTPGPIEPGHDFYAFTRQDAIAVTPLRLSHSHTELIGRLGGRLPLRRD